MTRPAHGALSHGYGELEPLGVCMQGFEPTVLEDWQLENHSNGCAIYRNRWEEKLMAFDISMRGLL